MANPVARLNDICTGHPDWPVRNNDQGCSSVYVDGRPVHCKSHHWIKHCCICGDHGCHDSMLASGSSIAYAEGLQIGRIGDPVACGGSVATGSSKVYVGG